MRMEKKEDRKDGRGDGEQKIGEWGIGDGGGRLFHTAVLNIINRIRLLYLRDLNCL